MCNSFALQSLIESLFALLLLVGTRKKLKFGYLLLSAYVRQSTIQQFAPGISQENIEITTECLGQNAYLNHNRKSSLTSLKKF